MILFVIFIHENPSHSTHGDVVMWWHSIVVVAVPVFFALSGYFFFKGVSSFDLPTYKRKLSKRIRTLLVPYLVWNCMPILFVVTGNLYSILFRGKSTNDLVAFLIGLWNDGIWHIWWDKTSGLMPFDSPLWYVRDLMILCVLSPLFNWLLRKLGWIFIVIVSGLYLSPLSFPVGFSSTGLLFFGLGSTFAIKGLPLDHINGGGRFVIYGIALCLFILSNVFHEQLLSRLFIMLSAYAWILLFCQLKSSVVDSMAKYSETVFFILALHNIIVLANVGKGLTRILPGPVATLSYWIAPIVTLFVCVIIYYGIKKVSPKAISVLCGGRYH